MKSRIKVLGINFLILFVGCIMIELIMGGWFRSRKKLDNLNVIRNASYQYESDLYTSNPIDIKYTRDKYGLRGKSTYNAPDKIDILTVGGSTTDQRYITDGKTWQDILENCFKKKGKAVLVSNAGIDGQSTFGHIKNFQVWFPNIPELKPKYILFYIGINDFYVLTDKSAFDDLLGEKSLLAAIKTNSVFFNLFRTINGILLNHNYKVEHGKTSNFTDIEYTEIGIAEEALYKLYAKNLTGFEKRLAILRDQTKSFGAEPIFITQPSIQYKKSKDNKLIGVADTSYIEGYAYNGIDYFKLLCELNKSIKKVANAEHLVIDLTTPSLWENDDFYDFYHNTPNGARKVGIEIFNKIEDKF